MLNTRQSAISLIKKHIQYLETQRKNQSPELERVNRNYYQGALTELNRIKAMLEAK
ncbi:hypothetical protein [Vibrio fluvialis]|uniref:hypothetical protein n=1 Tax=Vibrio fluvialis TaxID=676 RepID=UPI003D7DB5FA